MIGYIKGRVTGIFADCCFVEAGGIGYRVFMSDGDRQTVHTGEETKVLTYMAVREDAMTLYGFLSQEAYDLFLLLISVSKIGPKVAMGILSAVQPGVFSMAVRRKDLTALTKLPGIGRKTAERLLVELKDKLGDFGEEGETIPMAPAAISGPADEAAAALRSLGYEMDEVLPVLQKLAETIDDPALLIGAALRELGRERI